MTVYTDAEARQKLDTLLEQARAQGEVRIKRGDGQEFVVRPTGRPGSPLDVDGVDTELTVDEIVNAVREVRDR